VSDRIDIEPEVRALCGKFGIEHDATLEIVLRPSVAEAVVAKRNEHGKEYIDPLSGEIARDTFEYRVKT
jgi:hypothetical protein